MNIFVLNLKKKISDNIVVCSFSPFQMERQFEQTLKATRGLMIKKMRPDGACLFRAVGEFTSRLAAQHSILHVHTHIHVPVHSRLLSRF